MSLTAADSGAGARRSTLPTARTSPAHREMSAPTAAHDPSPAPKPPALLPTAPSNTRPRHRRHPAPYVAVASRRSQHTERAALLEMRPALAQTPRREFSTLAPESRWTTRPKRYGALPAGAHALFHLASALEH